MNIKLELDFGIKETLSDLRNWIKKSICKRKGHMWKKYDSSRWSRSFLLYAIEPDPTHICERCSEFKYVKEKVTKPKIIKFRKYSKLTTKKNK